MIGSVVRFGKLIVDPEIVQVRKGAETLVALHHAKLDPEVKAKLDALEADGKDVLVTARNQPGLLPTLDIVTVQRPEGVGSQFPPTDENAKWALLNTLA
jgi:hypothetical protein